MTRIFHNFVLPVLPALAIAFAGCATDSMEIAAGPAPGGSLVGLKTYSWAPGAGKSIRDPKIQDPAALDGKVRATVNSQLAGKGYAPATQGSGDFLVDYQVSVQDTTEDNISSEDIYSDDPALTEDGDGSIAAVGSGYGAGVVGSGDATAMLDRNPSSPTINIVSRGSILLEIKDSKTGKLLWSGNAHANIDPEAPEVARQAKVQEAIDGIMGRFPAAG